ncbi:hypothetical protein [Polaromonas sp. YR568]|uniref:hypothetical protein n=1 Tax=Polaromonas sp. YR568 TaxID=1855301 RepID=UPI003137E9A0
MSDSESSSQSSNDTQQTDNRRSLAQGAVSVEAYGGSSVNVTTLDAEVANNAVNKTTDAAVKNLNASLTFGADALTKAFTFGVDSQAAALASLDSQANLVKDAYADAKGRGALTDKILIGAIAMAGIVAFTAVRGK